MTRVLLGIGSNIERERHITAGLDAIAGLFGELCHSSVYDSPAIGFVGQPFLNLVVAVDSDLSLARLSSRLRHIEFEHGRPQNATRFSPRHLDIDILSYGDAVGDFDGIVLPRQEILENAFVLCPLAELAPDDCHPADGRYYRDLWQAFDEPTQTLKRVDFTWRGREISRSHQVG
ncbi:MAG: 2-amino-4-hydroxy-6-hydroxymethyldihydropteridine diphosphokinase [Bacteroidia bacterium]|jgi:2-amino-4-hydroxy-6-hydroxymethyldihydropteridine diphosphokinase